MTDIKSIQDVVQKKLCVSCGACVSEAPVGSMRMVLNNNIGMHLPEIVDPKKVTGHGSEFDVCPGAGLAINKISMELYGDKPTNSLELGRYLSSYAARSNDPQILERASSGGVMTAIANFLIQNNYVDAATWVKFEYGNNMGPRPVEYLSKSFEDLKEGQGSKYCPTSMNLLVRECIEKGGKYLFCGTPCQVAALRLAIRKHPELSAVFPLTMAHFCGGFRDYRQLDWIINKHGLNPADIEYFRFRGNGQPGEMYARSKSGYSVAEPYPSYLRDCPIPKLKRCIFCIDGTGQLADFACGDAWLPRYINDDYSWSIIISRSEVALRVIDEMTQLGCLTIEELSFDDVVKSQKSNLTSKVKRQYKRMKLFSLVGATLPKWDVELPRGSNTYWGEFVILIRKRLSRCQTLVLIRKRLSKYRILVLVKRKLESLLSLNQ
jgi:coenzyme F420 hydrogenase subunit beta